MQDDITDKAWKCFVFNRVLNVNVGGSKTKIVQSADPEGELLYFCYLLASFNFS